MKPHRIVIVLIVLAFPPHSYSREITCAAVFGDTQAETDGISCRKIETATPEEQFHLAMAYQQSLGPDFKRLMLGIRKPTVQQKRTLRGILYLLKQSAESGHAKAQFHYGLMFGSFTPDGHPRERRSYEAADEQSTQWILRSAENGYTEAYLHLAKVGGVTDGHFRDDNALEYLRQAAEHGSEEARDILTDIRPKIEALQRIIDAARKGDADAQYELGNAYQIGRLMIERNNDKARHWHRQAALQGHVQAQKQMAHFAKRDDDEEAVLKWYKRAADQGDKEAMYHYREISDCGLHGQREC